MPKKKFIITTIVILGISSLSWLGFRLIKHWSSGGTRQAIHETFLSTKVIRIIEQANKLEFEADKLISDKSYSEALLLLQKSLNLKQNDLSDSNSIELASTYHLIGKVHYLLEDYDQAITSLYKAWNIQKEHKNLYLQEAETLYLFSQVFADTGELKKAIIDLKLALRRVNKFLHDKPKHTIPNKHTQDPILFKADIYYKLGSVYRMAGNCKEAHKYHLKSYSLRMNNKQTHYTDLLKSQYALKEIKLYLGQ